MFWFSHFLPFFCLFCFLPPPLSSRVCIFTSCAFWRQVCWCVSNQCALIAFVIVCVCVCVPLWRVIWCIMYFSVFLYLDQRCTQWLFYSVFPLYVSLCHRQSRSIHVSSIISHFHLLSTSPLISTLLVVPCVWRPSGSLETVGLVLG